MGIAIPVLVPPISVVKAPGSASSRIASITSSTDGVGVCRTSILIVILIVPVSLCACECGGGSSSSLMASAVLAS